ncbi:MAG: hypothetical protein K6V97_11120 [Actinomycetia bacterium]|nr:hypothetical protein [Actinomycetes bacterium]
MVLLLLTAIGIGVALIVLDGFWPLPVDFHHLRLLMVSSLFLAGLARIATIFHWRTVSTILLFLAMVAATVSIGLGPGAEPTRSSRPRHKPD